MASVKYRGFRYESVGGKSWKVYFPGGHKFQKQFDSEADVIAAIDKIIEEMSNVQPETPAS